jgi:hypothetical protein
MPFEVHVDGADRPARAFSDPRVVHFPSRSGLGPPTCSPSPTRCSIHARWAPAPQYPDWPSSHRCWRGCSRLWFIPGPRESWEASAPVTHSPAGTAPARHATTRGSRCAWTWRTTDSPLTRHSWVALRQTRPQSERRPWCDRCGGRGRRTRRLDARTSPRAVTFLRTPHPTRAQRGARQSARPRPDAPLPPGGADARIGLNAAAERPAVHSYEPCIRLYYKAPHRPYPYQPAAGSDVASVFEADRRLNDTVEAGRGNGPAPKAPKPWPPPQWTACSTALTRARPLATASAYPRPSPAKG